MLVFNSVTAHDSDWRRSSVQIPPKKLEREVKNSSLQFSFNIAEVYLRMEAVFKCLNFFKENYLSYQNATPLLTFLVSGKADSFREQFVVGPSSMLCTVFISNFH